MAETIKLVNIDLLPGRSRARCVLDVDGKEMEWISEVKELGEIELITLPEDIEFLLDTCNIKGGLIASLVFSVRSGNIQEFPIDLKKYRLE